MKRNINNYIPFKGFYNLLAFKIPAQQFIKLWNIQSFLYKAETQRAQGFIHPQINEIRIFSAKYQQALFQFPIINPELI